MRLLYVNGVYGADCGHDGAWKRSMINIRFLKIIFDWAKIHNLSKNSHFPNHFCHKIHNFKITFFSKFTISKSHLLVFAPVCDSV